MSNILPAGTPAPDFTLHATPDQTLALKGLRGRPVILAFYPADWWARTESREGLI
jgi:peroxiredoxin